MLLTTGLAPVEGAALEAIGRRAVLRVNFLTDDPGNPAHRAPWFLNALPRYDHVFSPRRANLDDLRRLGCRAVSYLPFAFSPAVHYEEPLADGTEGDRFLSDIVFVGGADRDRIPYMGALIQAGLDVALYGQYWERDAATRAHARGPADARTVRKAIGAAKVALCLVRRANRDGHCMRTFEVPAMGACMLTEDTEEHRELFGDDEKAVVYFRTIPEMVEKAHWLVRHEEERRRLARAAHRLITSGGHTYADRLRVMLDSLHQGPR